MQEIKFKNTQFNPDITPFHDLAKQMAKAFGYTANYECGQVIDTIAVPASRTEK